jgi:hypothetical protein
MSATEQVSAAKAGLDPLLLFHGLCRFPGQKERARFRAAFREILRGVLADAPPKGIGLREQHDGSGPFQKGESMSTMTTRTKESSDDPAAAPSILLASDSERHGSTMHRALEQHGFKIEYAGDYAQIDALLEQRSYDAVLLEVTGQHAVEPAVEAALRVKRRDKGQFVGYLADAGLETSGLAGDAVFPRNAVRLPENLRRHLDESAE